MVYSHYVVSGTGVVVGGRLSILDMNIIKATTIPTGLDRVGQMRNISKLFLEDGTVYTIDANRQIINYDIDLNRKKNIVIDCLKLRSYPNGDVFIINNNTYYIGVRSHSGKAEYNPLLKVEENGQASYLNKDIRIKRIDNQMKDYPDLLAGVYENKIALVPQHQRKFFIINLDNGSFAEHTLPDEIPVDEKPALNQVENQWGKVKGEYVKNAAFKWCSYKDGKLHLIFHDRSGTKEKISKYKLYSLDIKNKVVSAIDSLPFKKPRFVDSSNPDELLVLENNILYKYRIE